ncbi:MAG: hypothetical protein MUC84_12260 [Solirubrobacteraceae bacterium]|jgi:hypothetical protein|nr:hypothetical protein [Solirubrobacteraceae bacterium]MCU0314819.1 hypothetical protein [Solirubrobacteraceae bacterium]
MRIDTSLALRAALVQAAAILVLGLATGLALSHAFFEDWGWVVGPLAWMLAAFVTVTVLRLPLGMGLLGAALAGLPSGVATLLGLHWLGAVLAVVLFALWCGGLGARRAAGPAAKIA